MRKPLHYIALFAALCIVLLCGCSQGDGSAPAQARTISYSLTHIASGMISYTAEESQASGTLILYGDGTGHLSYAGQTIAIGYDDSHIWATAEPDVLHPYTESGTVLVLEYYSENLTFLKN